MPGTKAGGQKAAETNKKKYGREFYAKIGAKGGKASNTGGFAYGAEGREKARYWGSIGGKIGKRGPKSEAPHS